MGFTSCRRWLSHSPCADVELAANCWSTRLPRRGGLGAASLFLGSNSILKNAVHLYEAVGFEHVPPKSLPDMHYARADVFMRMEL